MPGTSSWRRLCGPSRESHASFLVRQSGRSLLLAVACLVGLVSIHLMTLPLVAAVGFHVAWRHRAALWRHRTGMAVVLALGALSNGGYVARGDLVGG